MKKITKVIALVLSIMMLASALCGCGEKDIKTAVVEGKYGEGEISYPIATEGEELEYYVWLAGEVAAHNVTSMNDIDFVKELNKQTGINVKYTNPSSAQWDAQFDLLFTSTELPDIIQSNWRKFKEGGADGAIDAGYILDLTDLIPVYAPNYYKYLQENPRLMAAATSPKGRLYSIGSMSHDLARGTYGLYLRQDWLDELGLEVPETIDEWYTVLKAFKDKKGVKTPYSSAYTSFIADNFFNNAWKVGKLGIENGKVFYGPANERYVDYIKTMRKWAAEGLIDPNMPATGTKTFNAAILNNEVGAAVGWLASGLGTILRNGQKQDPKFNLVAAPIPVLNKGDRPINASRDITMYSDCAAISATSQNVELALRYLDYGFTEKGAELHNWGIEGVSFEKDAEGNSKYTDLILNHPDGLSVAQALGAYSHAPWGGCFKSNQDAYLQQLSLPQEQNAVKTWNDADDITLPEIILSAEEQEAYASVMTDIETHVKEVTTGVIFGTKDVSELENLSKTLYDMGLQTALDQYQAAYDRFVKAMK